MASGGDIDPGQIYMVGENGPEYFSTPTPGRITPMGKMGGGDFVFAPHIDARGADIGVTNRLARAMEASQNAATIASVRANMERSKRSVQRA